MTDHTITTQTADIINILLQETAVQELNWPKTVLCINVLKEKSTRLIQIFILIQIVYTSSVYRDF